MFLLILLLVQFNNCIAFKPRPELLGIPLTSGETCLSKVYADHWYNFGDHHTKHMLAKDCMVVLEAYKCSVSVKEVPIKDCPKCSCLNDTVLPYGKTTDISVRVPKINQQLVERIKKSDTFQLAGLTIPDTVFYVTISVLGISFLGLVAYLSPTALLWGPLIALAIIWLLVFGIGFLFTLGIGPPIEREPHEHFEVAIMSFMYALVMSIQFLPMIISPVPRAIWSFPDHLREKEIAAIEEKLHHAIGLDDLVFA